MSTDAAENTLAVFLFSLILHPQNISYSPHWDFFGDVTVRCHPVLVPKMPLCLTQTGVSEYTIVSFSLVNAPVFQRLCSEIVAAACLCFSAAELHRANVTY